MKITNILNPNNTLSVNRPLAHALGVNAAIVYAALISKQAYYEANEMLDNEGYFYSTIEDLEESTALSRTQQQRAIDTLLKANLIEFRLKGTPAKRYFCVIDDEMLLASLLETDNQVCQKVANKIAENLQTSLSETDNQVCEKVPNKIAENLQTSLSETDNQVCQKVANPIYKTKDNKSKNNQSKFINPNQSIAPDGADGGTEEREKYYSSILENIEYESFADKEKVSNLAGFMADVICSGKGTVRVNGGELPLEQVRQRFLELRRRHIEHVLTTLESDPISVRNPRAYLIILLYNAPLTVCDFQPRPAPQSRKPEVSKSSFDIDDVMREIKERYRKCAGRG